MLFIPAFRAPAVMLKSALAVSRAEARQDTGRAQGARAGYGSKVSA
ncbi:hypothetical protein [Sorangium cellulosum]|jgi:hypothetical protein|nr:hypothetical protein [Sorangium cellulosum]